MRHAWRDDALEIGEHLLEGFAALGRRVGDLRGDLAGRDGQAHRHVAQARAIIDAPFSRAHGPFAKVLHQRLMRRGWLTQFLSTMSTSGRSSPTRFRHASGL